MLRTTKTKLFPDSDIYKIFEKDTRRRTYRNWLKEQTKRITRIPQRLSFSSIKKRSHKIQYSYS